MRKFDVQSCPRAQRTYYVKLHHKRHNRNRQRNLPQRYAENINVFKFAVIPQRAACDRFGKLVLSVLGDVHHVFHFVGNVNDPVNVVLGVRKFHGCGKCNRKIVCKVDLNIGIEP